MSSLQPEEFKTHSSVRDSYIRRILSSIKINKAATGADGVSPRLLKLAEPGILSSLTKFTHRCIINSSWPTDWKISIVSLFYQKDSETLKSNYRPVSVLSAVSKIAERVFFSLSYTSFLLTFSVGICLVS